MKLKEVIERSCQFVTRVAGHKYGRVPQLKLSGHVNAVFPYIECEWQFCFLRLYCIFIVLRHMHWHPYAFYTLFGKFNAYEVNW